MKVRLILGWICNEKIQESFSKIVDMPALPPIGCNVLLDEKGEGVLGDFNVQSIWWNELEPSIFEVELEPMETGDEDKTETIEWMKRLGWSNGTSGC